MKIGISINEVLRDFIGQVKYTYDKYIGESNIKENGVTNFNLIEFFKFNNVDDLNKFLYNEASLEIFGHADQISDGLIGHFNNFLMDIKDDGEHEVEIVSVEFNKSIPSTFFFLSKTGCRIDKLRFVKKSIDEWDGLDMLITANPDALKNKPIGKIGIKINTSYNQDVNSDYAFDTILDFIKDINLREKILNTKITTYEEI
jgi:hypothetical protein